MPTYFFTIRASCRSQRQHSMGKEQVLLLSIDELGCHRLDCANSVRGPTYSSSTTCNNSMLSISVGLDACFFLNRSSRLNKNSILLTHVSIKRYKFKFAVAFMQSTSFNHMNITVKHCIVKLPRLSHWRF